MDVKIDCVGENCCAASQGGCGEAAVSIFCRVRHTTLTGRAQTFDIKSPSIPHAHSEWRGIFCPRILFRGPVV